MNPELSIIPIGGRIKAAGVGMDMFLNPPGSLDDVLREHRNNPPEAVLKSLFPHGAKNIRQFLRHFGLYRPSLKTDQGMSGNFLPFSINTGMEHSDLPSLLIGSEEGFAVPETHASLSDDTILSVQQAFLTFQLSKTLQLIEGLPTRHADKGRTPFFFIRTAQTTPEREFGMDVVAQVQSLAQKVLKAALMEANAEEKAYAGHIRDANLIYVQPDAYVTSDGVAHIERINCPDVGMFLQAIDAPGSALFPRIRQIIQGITKQICMAVARRIDRNRDTYLLTRSGVLENDEDILEQGEMNVLARQLAERGIQSHMRSITAVDSIPTNSNVLLMNIDYKDPSADHLLRRHVKNELQCFPNPFLQHALLHATGLPHFLIDPHHRKIFLDLASGIPKDASYIPQKIESLRRILKQYGIDREVLHARVGNECVPILRDASHSWRAFATRCERYPDSEIELRAIPLAPNSSLLESETGKRMHVYRFAAICND